jgi:hypothetical protein
VKRIDILYDGNQYSVGGRELDELKATIADGIAGGVPLWLEVNFGEGRPQTAYLMVTAATSIALLPTAIDESDD